MQTLKEFKITLTLTDHYEQGLYEGYKMAVEGILEDIQSSSAISVETIEKYLQDLLNK